MKRGLLMICALIGVSAGTGAYTRWGGEAGPVAAGGGYWMCHAAGLWRGCPDPEGASGCAETLSEGLGTSSDATRAGQEAEAMCARHLDRMVGIADLGGAGSVSRSCAIDGCQWVGQ